MAGKKKRQDKPWHRTYLGISWRCSPKGSYYKKRIKNFITEEELKALWFRDKAYLMEQPSIDRRNPNGNYIFNNCRYLERRENIRRPMPIYQYTLDGTLVKKWNRLWDARKYYNVGNIYCCASHVNGYESAAGYRWEWENINLKKKDFRKRYRWSKILQYDLSGKLIASFNKISEAARSVGVLKTSIDNCLKGRSRTSGGYKWQMIFKG